MKTINLQVNGKPLIFTGKSVSYAGYELFYSKMSNIAHRSGEKPAYVFDYDGKRLALPYDPKDKDVTMKIFKQVALLEKKRAELAAQAEAAPEPDAQQEPASAVSEAPAAEPAPAPSPEEQDPVSAPEEENAPAAPSDDDTQAAAAPVEDTPAEPSEESGLCQQPESEPAPVHQFEADPASPEPRQQFEEAEPAAPALAPEEQEFTMYYVPGSDPDTATVSDSSSVLTAYEITEGTENAEPETAENTSDFTLFDVSPALEEQQEETKEKDETPAAQPTDPLFDAFLFDDQQQNPQQSETAEPAAEKIDVFETSGEDCETATDENPKKPIYKRGWFIFVIILVIVGIISAIVGGISKTTASVTPDTKTVASVAAQTFDHIQQQ